MATLTDIGLRLLGGYGDRPESFSLDPTTLPPSDDDEEDEGLDTGYISSERRRILQLVNAVKAQRAKNEQEDMARLATADIPPSRGRKGAAPIPSVPVPAPAKAPSVPATPAQPTITRPVVPSSTAALSPMARFGLRLAEQEAIQGEALGQFGEGIGTAGVALLAGGLGIAGAGINIFEQTMRHYAKTGGIDLSGIPQGGLLNIKLNAIPQFNAREVMEAFKHPMERALQPKTYGGQAVYNVATFPFAILNAAAEKVGQGARYMGVDDNTATAMELAANLIGYSDLLGGAKLTRGAAARFKSALKRHKLNDPKLAKAAADARDAFMREMETDPDSPFVRAVESTLPRKFNLLSPRGRGPEPPVETPPSPDTPVVPPPETPVTPPSAPGSAEAAFDVTVGQLGTVTPDISPETKKARKAARKQTQAAVESTPPESVPTEQPTGLAGLEARIRDILRTTPISPETAETTTVDVPPAETPTPNTTPTVTPTTPTTIDLGGMGKAMGDNLRDMLWTQYSNDYTVNTAGSRELSLLIAHTLKTNGLELTREQFNDLVDEVEMVRDTARSEGDTPDQFNSRFQQYIRDKQDQLSSAPTETTSTPETHEIVSEAPPIIPETTVARYTRPERVQLEPHVTPGVEAGLQMSERAGVTDDIIQRSQAGEDVMAITRALQDRFPDTDISNVYTLVTRVREAYGLNRPDEGPAGVTMPATPTPPERPTDTGLVTPETSETPIETAPTPTDIGLERSVTETTNIAEPEAPVELTPQDDLARIRELLANPDERGDALTVLKTIVREGKKGRVNYAQELQSMGFTAEEATAIAPELSSLGSRRRVKPSAELARTSEETPTEIVTETPAKATVVKQAAQSKAARKRAPKTTPLMDQNFDGFYSVEIAAGAVDTPSDLTRDFLSPVSVPEPIKVGYVKGRQGNTPKSVVVDTRGMDTTESLADIQRQTADGSISEDVTRTKTYSLERKARALGIDASEAHLRTPDDVTARAAQLASRKGLDMYIMTMDGPKLLSPEARDGIAKLETGDRSEPSNVTNEEIAAYIEAKTPSISEQNLRFIEQAIETGEDITAYLPTELAEPVKAIQNEKRRGINQDDRRSFIAILRDINTLLGPPEGGGGPLSGQRGSIGGGPEARGFRRGAMSEERKLAAQRLQADWLKAKRDAGAAGLATVGTFEQFLRRSTRLPDASIAMISDYLDTVDNPPPPEGNIPINTAITADTGPVFDQRKGRNGRVYPPKYTKEVIQLQEAAKQKKAIVWGEPAIHTLRKYGLQDWWHTYYEQYRAATLEKRENKRTFNRLLKVTTKQERNRVAAFLYSLDPDGRRINNVNGITPPTAIELTPNEASLISFIQEFAPNLYNRLAESRKASGRDALDKVDNYLPIMRTFSVAERMGITPSLLTMPARTVRGGMQRYAETKFPYTQRRGGKFNAEYDVIKILRTYSDAAVDAIHLTPFTTKLNEFINMKYPWHNRPNRFFQLKNVNPKLHGQLNRWINSILGIPSLDIKEVFGSEELGRLLNVGLRGLSRNVAVAHIGYAASSVLNQTGALVNTINEIGLAHTLNGLRYTAADPIMFGKNWKFAMRESNVLDTRTFDGQVLAFMAAIRDFDIKRPYKSMLNFGTSALSTVDMILAVSAWHGAYRMHRKLGKNHDESRRLADEMVVRTQGSATSGDLTRMQQNVLTGAMFTLQNFAISQFYHIMNDVVGIGQGRSKLANAWRMLKWLTTSMVYGSIMNYLFDSENSQPDPIGEFVRSSENESVGMASWLAGLEVLQVAPMLGGALKYEKGLGGPVAALAQDVIREPEHVSRVFGVPKTAVELYQGEDLYDAFFRLRRRRRESTRTGL